MSEKNRLRKWRALIICIWILFLAAASVGCYYLQKADVYRKARTELIDQGEIISRQFASLVDTNYNARAVLYERLISEVKALAFALGNYDDIEDAEDFLNDIVNTTELKNLWI